MLNCDSYNSVALYLLSALIQADAAILGLGIVSLVYQFQHQYNVFQPYVTDLLKSKNKKVVQDCRRIVNKITKSEEERIIKHYINSQHYAAFEFLVQSKNKIQNTIKQFLPPLILVAFHCVLSAFSLWFMLFINYSFSLLFAQIWCGLIVICFAFSLLDIVLATLFVFDVKPLIKGFPLSSRLLRNFINKNIYYGG
jgi:hypothetical protein